MRVAHTRSIKKFICRASTQFQIPRSTIRDVLHKICDFVHIKRNYYRPSSQARPQNARLKGANWGSIF